MADGAVTRARVVAAFAAIYVIWGSTYLAILFAIETLPPFLMAGARFLIAGAVVYAWARARGAAKPDLGHWKAATIIGGLLLLGGNGGVVWAEQHVPSGLAALLVAMVPLWMVTMEWARSGERPARGVIAGLAIGMSGLALLVGPGEFAGGVGPKPIGVLVLVVASLSWAAGSIYARGVRLPSSPFLTTGMQMLAGGALLVVAGLLAGEPAQADLGAATAKSWLALLYLVVFGSLIGYTAYIWLLKVSTPAKVATYAYVNPVVAVMLGWAFAGETLSLRTLLAAAVIIAGVAMITITRSGRRPPSITRSPTEPPRDAGALPADRRRIA
ncbi:MAG TPA: drug/metabolite exporter YedA [Gemmatimonadaceae bacterium]|nr:drug/metabolite exporter YedA [Gemmatimonadaceae bacterium]